MPKSSFNMSLSLSASSHNQGAGISIPRRTTEDELIHIPLNVDDQQASGLNSERDSERTKSNVDLDQTEGDDRFETSQRARPIEVHPLMSSQNDESSMVD